MVPERLEYLAGALGVATSLDSQEVAGSSDVLFLTVKPQTINEVLDMIAPVVAKNTTVISIAAGITIATLQGKLPGVPIVRVMPNTAVAVGAGMSAIALGKYASAKAGELASAVFASVGRVVTVNEEAMDAVTGLSGSGPAFAYVLIDALADAGVRVGFSRSMATILAAQTLLRRRQDGAGDGRTSRQAARYGDIARRDVDRRYSCVGTKGCTSRAD